MNIPDEVIEQAQQRGEGNDADYLFIAEWARREALRAAAEDYGTPGMTATTQYVKEWLRDRADLMGRGKTDE